MSKPLSLEMLDIVRTGLAFVTLGLAIAKLIPDLKDQRPAKGLGYTAGVVFCLFGSLMIVQGAKRYYTTIRMYVILSALMLHEYKKRSRDALTASSLSFSDLWPFRFQQSKFAIDIWGPFLTSICTFIVVLVGSILVLVSG